MTNGSQNTFSCPKCGFVQNPGMECARCGVIFSRLKDHQAQKVAPVQPPLTAKPGVDPILDGAMRRLLAGDIPAGTNGPSPEQESEGQPPKKAVPQQPKKQGVHPHLQPGWKTQAGAPPTEQMRPRVINPLDEEVSPRLMQVRKGTGLLAMLFGVLLFMVGMNNSPDPLLALLMIAYVCVGAYWMLASKQPILLRRMLLEMVLFVAVTMGLRVNSPVVFELGQLTEHTAKDSGMPPGKVYSSVEEYYALLDRVLEETHKYIDGETEDLQTVKRIINALELCYVKLTDNGKANVAATQEKAEELKTILIDHEGNVSPAVLRRIEFLSADLRNR